MRRLLYLLCATAVLTIGTPMVPASATVNAGPWDVSVAWGTAGAGGRQLWYRVKMSVDSDDEANNRYYLCMQFDYHRDSPPGNFNNQLFNIPLWVSTADGSGNGYTAVGDSMLGHLSPPGGNAGAYTNVRFFVQTQATGCSVGGTGMPIRGRSNVTDVQSGQINAAGESSTPSDPSNPLGSGAYPTPDVPTFTDTTCSRILSQNNGANIATFHDTVTPLTGATDTYSWDWGDATTAGTTQNPQHIYPALTSQPDGGWTATLTVTRTGNGTAYNATPVRTATCALRIDYLNPEQSTPATTTQDPATDPDCPSGFGWLNPLSIIKALKCLFIPSSESVASLGTLWGDMTTKAPFSYAYEVVTFPGAVIQAIHDAALDTRTDDSGGTTCADVSGGAFDNLVGENHAQNGTTNCALETKAAGSLTVFRTMIWYLFLIGTALAIWQAITWTVS